MEQEQYEQKKREWAARDHDVKLRVGSELEAVKRMAIPWVDDAIMFLDRPDADIAEAITILREIRVKFQNLNS